MMDEGKKQTNFNLFSGRRDKDAMESQVDIPYQGYRTVNVDDDYIIYKSVYIICLYLMFDRQLHKREDLEVSSSGITLNTETPAKKKDSGCCDF